MRKVFNILSTIILVVLVAFAGMLFVPRIFGIEPLVVLSGSMEPTYHVGSVVYCNKNVDKDNIKAGDAITFRISEEAVVTHRVVKVNGDGTFVTKGDANNTDDGAPVNKANVIGVEVFTIPYIGYIAKNITSKTGIILLVTLILVILLLTFLPDILKMDDDDNKEAAGDA